MSEVKYVHLEAGDFLADPDFQMMTDAERGIYCSVIFYMYCNNGRIIDDAESIKRLCNSGNGFDKNWNRLRPKFHKKGKYLTHKRVRKELARAQKYIQDKRRAGVMGAESRWQADSSANSDVNGTPDGKPMPKQKETKQHDTKQNKLNDKGFIWFNEFWEIWPRKVAKDPARERWEKINPDEQLALQIIAAVRAQVKAGILSADKFTPHPATWLNASRWTDQLPKEAEKASRRHAEAAANIRKQESEQQNAAAKAQSNLKFAETLKQMNDAQLTTFWRGSKNARPEIERLRPDRKELFDKLKTGE